MSHGLRVAWQCLRFNRVSPYQAKNLSYIISPERSNQAIHGKLFQLVLWFLMSRKSFCPVTWGLVWAHLCLVPARSTRLTYLLDAEILCEVHSDLSEADEKQFKRKNRHFWNTGKPYFRVDYQVKVLLGPADIRFELCSSISSDTHGIG